MAHGIMGCVDDITVRSAAVAQYGIYSQMLGCSF